MHQRSHQVGGQRGHFGSHARQSGTSEFVPVRHQQECRDHGKTQDHGHYLAGGEKRDGITDEPDQRKGPHSAE